MKLTQIQNKVKMLLTELNMLILQFVVLMFFFTIFFSFTYLEDVFFTIFTIITLSMSLCFCPLSLLAVAVVEFPLVWLVNNDGEYVMGMLSETSSLFDDEDLY